jgi:hypothetical protein
MLSLTGSEMRRWMGWFDSGLGVEGGGWLAVGGAHS